MAAITAAGNRLNLQAVLDELFDDTTKGVPGGLQGVRLSEFGRWRWNILNEDLPLPIAILRESVMTANRAWMRAIVQNTSVKLAPHGKTTMAPQLFDRQLEDGCWGLTAATVEQLHVYRRFGVSRVLFANQLVGRQHLRYVIDEIAGDDSFEFICLVDSVEGVNLIAEAVKARRLERGVPVLLEVGQQNGRTGVRSLDAAREVATALAVNRAQVPLRGVEAYEGVLDAESAAETEVNVRTLYDLVATVCAELDTRQLWAAVPVLLSGGGSSHFDVAIDRLRRIRLSRPTDIIIRSGCYITSDDGLAAGGFAQIARRSPWLTPSPIAVQPALEVWGYVQSRPEPELVLVTLGKRDVSFDSALPLPKHWHRPGDRNGPRPLRGTARTLALNDQHLYLAVDATSPLSVGDLVGFGVSHPCLTFDRWKLIPVVDDNYTVVNAIRTFF